MFEKYTESARRALFFARYEVSHLGATELGTEHLLLGLIRESQGPVARIMALSHVSFERLRREIEGRSVFRERTATSVEIPLGAETQRALQFAAEEADRLGHSYIGTEHLLLGLLRDETSLAASILIRHGLRSDDVRNDLLKLLAEPSSPSVPSAPVDVAEQIDRITQLAEQLALMASDRIEARALTDRIRDSLTGGVTPYSSAYSTATDRQRVRTRIADDFIAELGYELPATRGVLERVPGDKARWKPHPRSSAFGHLAQLVARMPHMLADIVRGVDLDLAASPPYTFEPTSALLAEFDANVSELQSVLRDAADDVFSLAWSLRAGPEVLQTAPRKDVLRNTINHLVHHRAQLAVYLRLNDIPVPCMYGPTADERE